MSKSPLLPSRNRERSLFAFEASRQVSCKSVSEWGSYLKGGPNISFIYCPSKIAQFYWLLPQFSPNEKFGNKIRNRLLTLN